MRELIKKSILLGLGAASLTKEKIDKLAAELVKRKAITTKEGKWLAKEVLREIAKSKERVRRLGVLQSRILSEKARKAEKKLLKRGRRAAKSIISRAEKELG